MNSIKKLLRHDEKALINKMIWIYCKHHHSSQSGLCENCAKLSDYSNERIAKCPFGEEKPVCQKCKIHCYKKEYREKIKEVMKFSGKKIILYKPFSALKHLLKQTLD